MALEKTVTSPCGFKALAAYHRVEGVSLTDKVTIVFHVRSYKEQGKPFFAEQVVQAAYDINGENPFRQAYDHLKTLPDFQDAEDC
jgi:hypothetical protein